MATLRITGLPAAPSAAAAVFHADWLGQASALLVPSSTVEDLVLLFPPTDHTHAAWRLAAVQSLAREHAPLRINGVESDNEAGIAAALAYLAAAEGVTGQLLRLDSAGAGTVLFPTP